MHPRCVGCVNTQGDYCYQHVPAGLFNVNTHYFVCATAHFGCVYVALLANTENPKALAVFHFGSRTIDVARYIEALVGAAC